MCTMAWSISATHPNGPYGTQPGQSLGKHAYLEGTDTPASGVVQSMPCSCTTEHSSSTTVMSATALSSNWHLPGAKSR